MNVAYSALRGSDNPEHQLVDPDQITEIQLRHRAYLETCNKYRNHITEIQKYLPDWMPKFR